MQNSMVIFTFSVLDQQNRFWAKNRNISLKVVSTTLLLVSLLSLNGSTRETKKNVFYFHLKAFFILERIKF